MAYCPPNVTIQTLEAGTHSVFLTDLEEITDPSKLAKFNNAQAVFIATYKSTQTAIEIKHVIKFNGSKADFYAGLNIDRLHIVAGLPAPNPGDTLDLENLKALLDGIEFQITVNDKGYVNDVLLPEGAQDGPF